jgi:modulator of FtsH protease
MQDFAQLVQSWQTFYATIAASSATLVGLLFVALTLNVESVNLAENASLRLLARQTFTTFLYIIGLALTFLIPGETRLGLGLPLVLIAVLGMGTTLAELRASNINRSQPIFRTLFRRIAFKIIAFVLVIVIGFLIIFGTETGILDWMVSPMLFLLFSASFNTWSLLVAVQVHPPKE